MVRAISAATVVRAVRAGSYQQIHRGAARFVRRDLDDTKPFVSWRDLFARRRIRSLQVDWNIDRLLRYRRDWRNCVVRHLSRLPTTVRTRCQRYCVRKRANHSKFRERLIGLTDQFGATAASRSSAKAAGVPLPALAVGCFGSRAGSVAACAFRHIGSSSDGPVAGSVRTCESGLFSKR